jgi:hypothetical protein
MADSSRSPGLTSLQDYFEDARLLDEGEFIERHGSFFFLRHSPLRTLSRADAVRSTVVSEGRATSPDSPTKLKPDFLVFGVPRDRRPRDGIISIGRSEENQVVILDMSVSSRHAVLSLDSSDQFLLYDAGSCNGTLVDDRPVEQADEGSPTVLESGARVVFGQVTLTFLRAGKFKMFVQQLLSK